MHVKIKNIASSKLVLISLFCTIFFYQDANKAQAAFLAESLSVSALTGATGVYKDQSTEESSSSRSSVEGNGTRTRQPIKQVVSPGVGWKFEALPHALSVNRVVAVDKSKQRIMLYERKSPLKQVSSFFCTTGQAIGDKKVQGDLRTPEGIYFVVNRIGSGLNYELYGNEAYTLNYPNPVDKLRRKTGYGIWIHGRGYDITPLETQGCVAMNNIDLALFGKELKAGLAVALADVVVEDDKSITSASNTLKKDEATIRKLRADVNSWAQAWGGRSAKMFDFYDKEAYSLTQEPFSQFKAQKERLFAMLPWIKNDISDVQVLKGPDYWVTWFVQDYKAPNLQTKGVRRLYWEERANGNFQIVGMEWLPGLTIAGDVMVASAEDPGGEKSASPAPLRAEGGDVIVENKATISTNTPPISTPKVVSENTATSTATNTATTTAKTIAEANNKKEEKTVAKAPTKEQSKEVQIRTFVEAWRVAWESANLNSYAKYYSIKAEQGKLKGQDEIKKNKKTLWAKAKPAKVTFSNIRTSSLEDGIIKIEMTQVYQDKNKQGDKGIKTLHLKFNNNKLEIVREDWRK